jgi:thiamine-phosphate pyrophosphorylase
MRDRLLLCYITNRVAFPGDERARRLRLLEKIAEAAANGVDYIQLREKDLPTRELESLAKHAVEAIGGARARRGIGQESTLLINSRTDVALSAGAGGVHLRSDDVSPQDVRAIWKTGLRTFAGGSARATWYEPVVGVSCHSVREVLQAAANQASFTVFGPVFEKAVFEKDPALQGTPAGLDALRTACLVQIPVLALGGVTLRSARACLDAGAAGIAAIRLFQENNIADVVRALRG